MGKLILFYIGMSVVAIIIFVFIIRIIIIGVSNNEGSTSKKDNTTANNYECKEIKTLMENEYQVHKTKPLTEEQIADIHARGKITPAEKVKELEGLGMCIGDYAGSAAWRCHKFGNCHDCLVDYANTQDEHTSFFDDLKIICK